MTEEHGKTFTIILVDDHHDQMTRQIAEIREYLGEKGFSLNLLPDKKGDSVMEYLEKEHVDMMLTDKNLPGTTGTAIIKKVRNSKFLTDILFYSGVSVDDIDILQLTTYFSVEVIRDREIVPAVKKMINKNILKWSDVIFLRGIIISNTIELEAKVNEFFMKYFKVSNSVGKHFDLLLEGTTISLEGKRLTLQQIIKGERWGADFGSLTDEIRKIQTDRNILAHSRQDTENKNLFYSRGEDQTFDKNRMKKMLKKIDVVYQQVEKIIEKI